MTPTYSPLPPKHRITPQPIPILASDYEVAPTYSPLPYPTVHHPGVLPPGSGPNIAWWVYSRLVGLQWQHGGNDARMVMLYHGDVVPHTDPGPVMTSMIRALTNQGPTTMSPCLSCLFCVLAAGAGPQPVTALLVSLSHSLSAAP